MVESVEEIYLPSDSYWQKLVTIHNCFGNVPLEKHQCSSDVLDIQD